MANSTEVEAESQIAVRALDGSGNQTGPTITITITITVFSRGGVTSDVWGFGSTADLVSGVS